MSFLRLHSASRCIAIPRRPSDSGPWTDGSYSAYDTVTDRIWDNINKDVCSLKCMLGMWTDLGLQRQWKDIRSKYIESEGGDDGE